MLCMCVAARFSFGILPRDGLAAEDDKLTVIVLFISPSIS